MLESGLENEMLGLLAILVIVSLFLLHFLLFKEYSRQKRIQIKRLNDFEKLVNLEIQRSQALSSSLGRLQEMKDRTDEKLQIIKLQVAAIDSLASKSPLKE